MTKPNKMCLLGALYVAQGLPYGFFTQALPVFLRESGASLPAIGASTLLTIPWALKFLWAPLIDRFSLRGVGLRRSWLLPLQGASVALFIALSFFSPAEYLMPVLIAFLLTNFLAASQDVATDGLAVDLLTHDERGWANGIQVAGYRLGMIIGGGAILAVFGHLKWSGVMLLMAALAFLCTIPVMLFKEPPHEPAGSLTRSQDEADKFTSRLREVLHFFTKRGALPWIGILLLYKTGHSAATSMLRPWLVDRHYSLEDIAWILGSAGFVAGFAGAVFGGFIASKFDRRKLLAPLGLLQALAVTSYLLPISTTPATWKVALATSLDHFTSGMATATLFTLMMDATSRERAASDYTVQACLIVIATSLGAAVSGWSAHALGYETHFLLASCVGFVAAFTTAILIRRAEVRSLLEN